jgi:uncharacterized membrane protein
MAIRAFLLMIKSIWGKFLPEGRILLPFYLNKSQISTLLIMAESTENKPESTNSETTPPPAPAPVAPAGMDPKVIAILSYITIFGWIAAVVLNNPKKPLGSFHIRQSLCLMLAGLALSIIAVIPLLGWLLFLVGGLALFVFWVMGLIGAIQAQTKPLPLIGEKAQEWFQAL